MFTQLSEFFFRPTRKMLEDRLEDRIDDLSEKLWLARGKIQALKSERERTIKELTELTESVFVKKQAD